MKTTERARRPQLYPSVMFSGTSDNAFCRHVGLLGGEILLMVTYGDAPPKSQVQNDWHEKVRFARLRAGGFDITGGDVASSETPSGFSIVIGVPNAAEADRVCAGLVEAAKYSCRCGRCAGRYGVVRDPFRIRWEINCDAEPAA